MCWLISCQFSYLNDSIVCNGCLNSAVGTNRYDMEASVTSPSGVTEMCDIQDLGMSQYSIKFIPKEMGIHTVSVKHRGMHIPGCFHSFFLLFGRGSISKIIKLSLTDRAFVVIIVIIVN